MSLDLDAIEARAAAATPGPWVVQRCIDGRESINAPEWDGGVWVAATEDYATDYATEDAEFIAHAREDVPALIAEVKRLRGQLEWTRNLASVRGAAVAGLLTRPPVHDPGDPLCSEHERRFGEEGHCDTCAGVPS